MKTIKLFFGIVTALLVLESCNKETPSHDSIPEGYAKAVFKVLDTKSILDGTTIKWEEKDYLAAYSFAGEVTDEVAGDKLTKVGNEVTSTAEFTGVMKDNATVAYVTYPFYCNTASDDKTSPLESATDGTIITNLPGAQKLVANGIDGACNLAACKATITDEDGVKVLSGEMRNLVSYLKFTLDGTKNITQVLVETRNNKRISGMSEIVFNEDGAPSATAIESHYVMGYAGNGNNGNTVIPAGTYYLCAIPVDLTTGDETGLKITISASDGKVYEYITRGVKMRRNQIYNLGTLDQLCVLNENLQSVVMDFSKLGTKKSTERKSYTLSDNSTGAYMSFYYNSSKGYLQATNDGFITPPVIDGKHLTKVNVVLRAHTSSNAPSLVLRNDTIEATIGDKYATGEYRPVASNNNGKANSTLKLYRQTVHVPNYFHQFVVGSRGDLERNRTIDSEINTYQLANISSVASTDETTTFIDRLEFIYEKNN